MPIPCRFIEACALLPLLHVDPAAPSNTILCLGSSAEKFAADCLRWRDVTKVYVLAPPAFLHDKRVEIGLPPPGSCAAVLTSPDEPADAYTSSLRPDGIFCASTLDMLKTPAMLRRVRGLFPRSVVPWRDHLPEVIFGALASPRGVPQRRRDPPQGAQHLSRKFLPSLFTFAADETPLVFGPQEATRVSAPTPEAARGQQPLVPSR